jgi:nucleotide-binding universal stress UspA family protein
MHESGTPPSIVVGIDGSKTAILAALWAIDEAVSRDIPLRLVYALDPTDVEHVDPGHAARKLAAADIAIRYAFTAIEATNKPVKVEVEITQGSPVSSLIRASRSAAIVCVGAVGYRHFQPGHVGSTAAALATNAHCPVAIIRNHDCPRLSGEQYVVVEADASPDNGVLLETAVAEACLRNVPLRIVTPCGSRRDDDEATPGDVSRRVRANLDRRLALWRRRYPDLRAESVATRGSILDYLGKNARSVQLVVVDARSDRHVQELTGPAGTAMLGQIDCSVLIVDRPHL